MSYFDVKHHKKQKKQKAKAFQYFWNQEPSVVKISTGPNEHLFVFNLFMFELNTLNSSDQLTT